LFNLCVLWYHTVPHAVVYLCCTQIWRRPASRISRPSSIIHRGKTGWWYSFSTWPKLARGQLIRSLTTLPLIGLVACGAKVEKHFEFAASASNRGAKVAEVCKTCFPESIGIIKSSESEDLEFVSSNQRELFFAQGSFKSPKALLFGPRRERANALIFERGRIWLELGCIWCRESKRANKSEIVCRSLSKVSHIGSGLNDRIRIDQLDVAHEHIGTQFVTGMSPSGYPQQPRCEEQGDREQGYKRGAKRNYFGIVLSEKFKNAFDVVLIVFVFTGPLFGFGFLFLNCSIC